MYVRIIFRSKNINDESEIGLAGYSNRRYRAWLNTNFLFRIDIPNRKLCRPHWGYMSAYAVLMAHGCVIEEKRDGWPAGAVADDYYKSLQR